MSVAFYLILSSLAVNTLVFVYIFRSVGFSKHKTLSDHVSKGSIRKVYVPESIGASLLFSSGLLLLADSFTEFKTTAYALVLLNLVAHTVLVLVPRVKEKVSLHDDAAAVYGISALVFIIVGFIATDHSTFSRTAYTALISIMIFLGAYIYDKTRSHYVYLQLTYYICKFIGVLALATQI